MDASPIMAHAPEEMDDITSMTQALVLNIGTLDAERVGSMHLACDTANRLKIPVILDPVGVGASRYRTQTVESLIKQYNVAVIRGNATEIANICGLQIPSRGVDSTIGSTSVVDMARRFAKASNIIVVVSGKTDFITDGSVSYEVRNEHELMTRVTGIGCAATALIAAFTACNSHLLTAATHAMLVMGIAGEVAAACAKGPGSFKVEFIDALYQLNEATIKEKMQVNRVGESTTESA